MVFLRKTFSLSLANVKEEICMLSSVWITPANFPTKTQAACSGYFTLSTVDAVWLPQTYTILMCQNSFTDPYSAQQSMQPSISFYKNLWQAATQPSHCVQQLDLRKNLQKNSSYLSGSQEHHMVPEWSPEAQPMQHGHSSSVQAVWVWASVPPQGQELK